jgi:hypothetical protein
MVQIQRPSQKRILRTGGRKELLEFPHVIQLQISNRRLDAQVFSEYPKIENVYP